MISIKMDKILPLVALLAVTEAKMTLDDVIAELARRREMNNPDPDVQTRIDAENNSCRMDDGREGECVYFYLCNNGTFVEDGSKVIDIRTSGDSDCKSYLSTCCASSDRRTSSDFVPQPPATTGCGWRNSAGAGFSITGAENNESQFAEFPWMVAIFRKSGSGDPSEYQYLGGGSLIHPSIVLTAAHVVRKYAAGDLRVRAGEWDTRITGEPIPHQERDIAEVVSHADFHNESLYNDVALLFLSAGVRAAASARPACLPPAGAAPAARAPCLVAGWGKDRFGDQGRFQNILKKVSVEAKEHSGCQSALRKSRLGRHFRLHASFLCAGGAGHDACEGDGGSPLVCPATGPSAAGRYIQYGIVAWGIGCGGPQPGVYVDVGRFRAWVDGHVTRRGYDPAVYTL